jgi:hypothetical protein
LAIYSHLRGWMGAIWVGFWNLAQVLILYEKGGQGSGWGIY